jgi:hypothetical protein
MRIARFRFTAMLALGCLLSAQRVCADDVTYGYSYVPPEPSPATPRIKKVELNSEELEAGGTIAIRVTTTPDVVSVVTGSGKRQGSLARSGRGVFVGESTLPHVGGFLRVHIKLRFDASTADGRSTVVEVPVIYK